MICQNCKKDIKQDDKFCPNCGEKNYKPDFVLSGQPQKISFWIKIKKLGWIYWILIGIMTFSIITNIVFDVQWVLYLLITAAIALFIYGLYIQEKELTPEENEAESKAILYPFWKKKWNAKGKSLTLKKTNFIKRNIQNLILKIH